MRPGEYSQPLVRIASVHVPLVSGYTTARLLVDSVSGYDSSTRAMLENTGENSATIQLIGTDDYVSGPRSNIGGPITLVPRGQAFSTFTPTRKFLEIKTTAGNSFLRAQLESLAEWRIMSFDKSEVIYPPTLAKHQPDTAPFPI
jgi:hypothetical protein